MSSVLSQGWPELEYLVVDPGSSDDTPAIIRRFEERYPGKIISITEPDAGPADGLNKAFARAKGDLFSYLNADDLYLPGCFHEAAAAAAAHPEAGAIYADGYKSDANGRITRHVVSTRFSPRRFVYGGCLALQQSTFYRREAFSAVGGFNLQNRTSWDAEILLDMALSGVPLVHVAGYWSVFRIHAESITGSQRLAEESQKTHARYFRRVMGRERGRLDRAMAKGVMACSLLLEPRGTALRILDRIWQPKADISEYLHEQ
jgi:glycosyltransferase involved in cell wall biosynthesis